VGSNSVAKPESGDSVAQGPNFALGSGLTILLRSSEPCVLSVSQGSLGMEAILAIALALGAAGLVGVGVFGMLRRKPSGLPDYLELPAPSDEGP
jgi:hypothetical protein